MSVFPRPIPEAPKARPEHRHWVILASGFGRMPGPRNRTSNRPKPQPSPDNVLYGGVFRLGKEAGAQGFSPSSAGGRARRGPGVGRSDRQAAAGAAQLSER